MKRTIIAILIIAVLASVPVLASSKAENSLGLIAGFGYQYNTYKDDNNKITISTLQMPLAITDTVFFDKKSAIGLFAEIGLNMNLSATIKTNDSKSDPQDLGYDDGTYPTFFDITLGAAYRTKSKDLNLLLGAGVEIATKTSEYKLGSIANAKLTETYVGLGLTGGIAMNLGNNVDLVLGAKASLWFISHTKYVGSITGTTTDTRDDYFAFSILPRATLTYTF